MTIKIYENAPKGEYNAIFTGAFKAPFGAKKAMRIVVGFLLLDRNCANPLVNAAGVELAAVSVCNNADESNPRSKSFRIRKAMLLAQEFDL